MIHVRPAVLSDALALSQFGARTFRVAFAAENRPENLETFLAKAYGVPQQSAELADPSVVTLIAEASREMIGFAQLRSGVTPACVIGPHPIELWRFYVAQEWHGRGVASTLMAAVVTEALRRGARTLWLGVWERNGRAQAFYRKCGYLVVGEQSFLLGNERQTDLVMARPVSQPVGVA
jgi:ribosomal protein S18 acetylase RimI-like enzyme